MSESKSEQQDFDEFAAYAQQVKKDRAEQKARLNSGGNFNFEQTKWLGLINDEYRVMRIVSKSPLMKGTPYKNGHALELNVTDIKDDDGKFMRLRLPLRGDILEKDHVIWKIWAKINESTWKDKEKISKYATVYPDLWRKIVKGGNAEGTPGYKYSRGWGGQRVILLNVIDREDDWCKNNKHTKMLSKYVNTTVTDEGEDREWPTIGVPSYGFVDELANLISDNGAWINYDIAIKKTGTKQNPYRMENASTIRKAEDAGVVLNKLSKDKLVCVVTGSLTFEELDYESYDFEKYYSPTSYSTILRKLGGTLKEFDSTFKTEYYDEVVEASKVEASVREEMQKIRAENEAKAESKPVSRPVTDNPYDVPETKNDPAEEPRRAVHRDTPLEAAQKTKLTPEKISILKGWESLTKEQQDVVEDVIIENGKVADIKYNTKETLCKCPECGARSPLSYAYCIACNVQFE